METKNTHNTLNTQENGKLKGYASIFNIKDIDGDIGTVNKGFAK
ncbi:hypothetical protein Cyrtocomes_01034 [Candidatus Cyrtobacter comes]|uniref:Uncharacterized protein n=1 Tax=Candidatus Cyrtobacter comes TaxID=675776 RepID=A0ABU5L946_9RICK|nr:hypothetical protein [Candidatus Cyrtobacter comes]